MPLPSNPKDRQKILILVAVAILGALYAVWEFVYQPMVASRQEAIEEIAKLERDIQRAQQQVRKIADMSREVQQKTLALADLSESFMIHTTVASDDYVLQAFPVIQRHAQESGVRSYETEEVGLVALPPLRGSGAVRPEVQSYALRVSAFVSYEVLKDWLHRMEEENPLLSIHSLLITSRENNPQIHRVSFEVRWPVWIKGAMRQQVLDEAAAVREEVEEEVEL